MKFTLGLLQRSLVTSYSVQVVVHACHLSPQLDTRVPEHVPRHADVLGAAAMRLIRFSPVPWSDAAFCGAVPPKGLIRSLSRPHWPSPPRESLAISEGSDRLNALLSQQHDAAMAKWRGDMQNISRTCKSLRRDEASGPGAAGWRLHHATGLCRGASADLKDIRFSAGPAAPLPCTSAHHSGNIRKPVQKMIRPTCSAPS